MNTRRFLASLLGSTAILAPGAVASAAAPEGRIVNGTLTGIQQVPWQVSVWSRGGDFDFDCGGSIIDASTVVTAAHCVVGTDLEAGPYDGGLGVTAGISDLNVSRPGDDPQGRAAVSARVHPGFVEDLVQTTGDLAILTLDEPLDLSGPAAKAIALPPVRPIVDNDPLPVVPDVLVSGFGLQQQGVEPDGRLYSLVTRIVDPMACDIDDNAIAHCVQTPTGVACSGDSGGPLVTQTTPPVLVGVVSNGPVSCSPNDADRFVNLLTPENRFFIEGDPTPPTAPRTYAPLSYRAAFGLVAGQVMECGGGGFSDPDATVRWLVSNDNGDRLATGTGPSLPYRLAASDIGRVLRCSATAANDGGVAVARWVDTRGPVGAPSGSQSGGSTLRPAPAPAPAVKFRLLEAKLKATAPRSAKRGKLVRVSVSLSGLFASADTGSICAKQGSGKAKCVALAVKGQEGATATFRFRIPKKARKRSLQRFRFEASLAGRNPATGAQVQLTRTAAVKVRVAR